jgi:hypothetical protein
MNALMRSFDSSAPELSSDYRVGDVSLKCKALIAYWGWQIVGMIHLSLVYTRTTYKNIVVFYIDSISVLGPSRCCDFDYVASFTKFLILAEI